MLAFCVWSSASSKGIEFMSKADNLLRNLYFTFLLAIKVTTKKENKQYFGFKHVGLFF